MTYLITQTFILLLIAGLLGLVLGWYLTRIAAAASHATLQGRLESAEKDVRELRGELDAAVSARGQVEAERRQLADELGAARVLEGNAGSAQAQLKAELADCQAALAQAQAGSADSAALQAELAECRTALEALTAPASVSEREVDSRAIASAAAAAAAAQGLIGDVPAASGTVAQTEPVDAEDDDLQRIKGIGPKIAGILGELGVRRFEQIANWTPERVEEINDHLKFKGRIEREQWIPQAQALLEGRDPD